MHKINFFSRVFPKINKTRRYQIKAHFKLAIVNTNHREASISIGYIVMAWMADGS